MSEREGIASEASAAADIAGAAPSAATLPLWRRVLPFLIALVLLAFVVGRLDWATFGRALSSINYVAFVAFTLVFSAALLTSDTFATAHIYRTRICPVRFRELFVIRAASYLPSLLNHHVGQGWLTYFMAKNYKAPLWRVTGATLLVYATTFACLFLLGAAALPFNYERIGWLLPTVATIGVAGVAYMIVVAAKPKVLREMQATAPLMEAGVGGHLLALAYRLPHVVVLFCGTLAPFWFFGVRVPVQDALAFIPVIMLVSALPITPQGIGTRDVIALQLLAGYAAGGPDERAATLAAATLTWAGALTLVQAGVSPWFMRRAQRLLREGEGGKAD